ncbi:MAG TPA: hypothetical protein PLQ88_24085 [Blastocatellia bacterium]|nr:hypothetical protein [Blastocatellia bacterium]
MFYQANSERIGRFIEGKINELEAPVFLLAHSLGGIACVDLLVRKVSRHQPLYPLSLSAKRSKFFDLCGFLAVRELFRGVCQGRASKLAATWEDGE